MKLIAIGLIIFSVSSVQSAKICASAHFTADSVFDTDLENMNPPKITYVRKRSSGTCYASFYIPQLPETFANPEKISDCTQHINKNSSVTLGYLNKAHERINKMCYYQHNWVICFCDLNKCNSPQFWSLMLARFAHSLDPKSRKKNIPIMKKLKEKLKKFQNIEIKNSSLSFTQNLHCLMWFADLIGQEEDGGLKREFNYITTDPYSPSLKNPLYSRSGQSKTKRKNVKKERDFEMKWTVGLPCVILTLVLMVSTIILLILLCRGLENPCLFNRILTPRVEKWFEWYCSDSGIPSKWQRYKEKTKEENVNGNHDKQKEKEEKKKKKQKEGEKDEKKEKRKQKSKEERNK